MGLYPPLTTCSIITSCFPQLLKDYHCDIPQSIKHIRNIYPRGYKGSDSNEYLRVTRGQARCTCSLTPRSCDETLPKQLGQQELGRQHIQNGTGFRGAKRYDTAQCDILPEGHFRLQSEKIGVEAQPPLCHVHTTVHQNLVVPSA